MKCFDKETCMECEYKIRADEREKQNEFFNFDEVIRIECEKARADERAKVLDEVIKKLAESEDTILSDKQYYTLMEINSNEYEKCDKYCHSCKHNFTTEDEQGLYHHHCKLGKAHK